MKKILMVGALALGVFVNSQLLGSDETLITNSIDKKQYRALTLDNGLRVLLVSDPRADMAAASLDVHIGSGSDPEEWEGLAHFLEHMLFLGTSKYPEAGEYQQFMKEQGGSHNAYTALEHTNYFFNVQSQALEQALDRFSRFFIDPLFTEKYVDREREVVHSEYQARLKEDGRRIWDAGKVLINPSHPAAGFSVGSRHTLRDRESSSARDRLIEFYNTHYSANLMTLAVLGQESLDQLEQWVSARFSDIPNRNATLPVFQGEYFDSDLMPAKLMVLPEKDQNNLTLQFPIPSMKAQYRAKPLSYIANLVGHEGEGSLLAELKQRGWAESLSAGGGYADDVNGVFSVSIKLTEQGLAHTQELVGLFFEYVALIEDQGIESWRYEEVSQLARISFEFEEEFAASRLVRSLAARMHEYPVNEVLSAPYLMEEFSAAKIKSIMTLLNPDNMNMTLVSRNLMGELPNQTAFYAVNYALEKQPERDLVSWREARSQDETEALTLALPEPNPYIPERLTLTRPKYPSNRPLLSKGQDTLSFWYRPDLEFGLPKASFYFSIMSPIANDSAEHSVMLDIVMRLLNDQLNASVYPAYLAGLNYSLYRHPHGFSVRIDGFEDKQSVLLDTLISAIKAPEYREDRFNIAKTDLIRRWRNSTKESPSNQTFHELYRLVMQPSWTDTEKLTAIDKVSIDSVKNYFAEFFKEVKINVLSHGDVSFERAAAAALMVNGLVNDSVFIHDLSRAKVRVLPEGADYVRTLEVDHSDTALLVYYQGESDDLMERAKMALLGQLIETPFYTQLRTNHRVGYLVHSGSIPILRWPGLFFSAQSPSHSAADIEVLIAEFLTDFQQQLEMMPEDVFDQAVQGLLAKVLIKDKNLAKRSGRYWREIDYEETNFDSREQLAGAIESLSLQQIRTFFNDQILTEPKKITIQSAGTGDKKIQAIQAGNGRVAIGDATAFRKQIR